MPASAITLTRDADGIVTLLLDDPSSSVNTMNDAFMTGLEETVPRLEAEREDITGVLLRSAKRTFFAGGDLNRLSSGSADRAAEETAYIDRMKDFMRRLERLGRPVVALLEGTALGGGLEVALCAHHRIATDAPDSRFGLPEVGLGLIPGGGGITRTVRMLGLRAALSEVILPARRFAPRDALAAGLVDEVVADAAEAETRARDWIAAHPDAVQPWDVKGFRLPGGDVRDPGIAAVLPALSGLLRKRTKGAPMPASRAALAAAVEGAHVDFDTASRVETRYLVSQVTKNMIKAFFFDLRSITSGASRPQVYERFAAKKAGVVGAGMMGAGIAYVSARAGIGVVLRDVTREAAEKGKDYARGLEEKAVAAGGGPARRPTRCSAGSRRPTRPPTSRGSTWSSRRSSSRPRSSSGCSRRSRTSCAPTRCSAPTPRPCPSPSSPGG